MAEKEYIEREKALSAQNKSRNLSECRKRLERIPAADVRPVVRGRWEYTVIEGDVISEIPTIVKGVCSVCHNYSEEIPKWIYDDGGHIWFNFCPNCGADMREES